MEIKLSICGVIEVDVRDTIKNISCAICSSGLKWRVASLGMKRCSAFAMVLTTGGVICYLSRKSLKRSLFKSSAFSKLFKEESMEHMEDTPETAWESRSMETIIKNAKELRNLISESSFDSQASDLSLSFIYTADINREESDDEEEISSRSFLSDTSDLPSLKKKPWNIQHIWKLTELSFMSPDRTSKVNFNNLTALEWEYPGQGWHDIKTNIAASDYGSNCSDFIDSSEEVQSYDDSDQDFWEWDSVCSYKTEDDEAKTEELHESEQLNEEAVHCDTQLSRLASHAFYDQIKDTISPIVNHSRHNSDRQRHRSRINYEESEDKDMNASACNSSVLTCNSSVLTCNSSVLTCNSSVLTSSMNLTPRRDCI